MTKKPISLLIAVFVAAILAALFVLPRGIGARLLPWRLGLDLVGGAHLVYEIDMRSVDAVDRDSVLSGLRGVIERRVNLYGVSEPQVVTAKEGGNYRLIVELAGIKNVADAIKEIGSTPFLMFAEVEEVATSTVGTTTPATEARFIPTQLTGRYVRGAQLALSSVTGEPQVTLEFDKEGSQIFETLTGKNVGRPIAVFLDNTLITAPIVQQKITGGRAQITGRFTIKEAKELVSRFNAGALPAPINLVSQQTIGASLGIDSLNRIIFAGIIGTLLVMLFMVIYYRTFGWYASLALLIYIAFSLFVFKIFGITMTLAGIAGIVLSIGMAVDANILIFERSREERARGLDRVTAIGEGFKRAWPSIRDSNITTIITSVILYYFTSGFIKGFALAMFLGVLVSMFSAITVTKTMLRVFVRR